MEEKEMLTIILSILIPILSGLGWIINKMFKLQKEITDSRIEVIKEITIIDSRLSHLEGYLMGFNQKTGTDRDK